MGALQLLLDRGQEAVWASYVSKALLNWCAII